MAPTDVFTAFLQQIGYQQTRKGRAQCQDYLVVDEMSLQLVRVVEFDDLEAPTDMSKACLKLVYVVESSH